MFEISGVRYSFSKVKAFKYQVACYLRIFRYLKTGFQLDFQVPAFSTVSLLTGFSKM